MLYGVILSTRMYDLAREPVAWFWYFTLQPIVVSKERFWPIPFIRSRPPHVFVFLSWSSERTIFVLNSGTATQTRRILGTVHGSETVSRTCVEWFAALCMLLCKSWLYTHTHTHTHTYTSKDFESLAGPLLCSTVVSIYDSEQNLAGINRSERYLCSTSNLARLDRYCRKLHGVVVQLSSDCRRSTVTFICTCNIGPVCVKRT